MSQKKLYPNLIAIHLLDAVLVTASIYAAHLFRFEFNIPEDFHFRLLQILPVIVCTKLAVFHFFDLYRGMWRYTSINDLLNVIKASLVSSLILIALILLLTRFKGYSRSVFLIDIGFTIILVGGLRLTIRFYFERFGSGKPDIGFMDVMRQLLNLRQMKRKHLLIVGAGNCSEKLYREIRDNPDLGYRVIGFMDDDPVKWGMKIHGRPVLGAMDRLETVCREHLVDEIIIAIPSADSRQMRRIVKLCSDTNVSFKTVPSYSELIDGSVSIRAIREVAYRDLLGREVVSLDHGIISACLTGDDIMVTGAGGSIGSELCRQAARFRPQRIVLMERAESPLFDIESELRSHFPDLDVIAILGDICDAGLLEMVMQKYQPKTIFHAAAYKHVPMLETQPWKAVDNNIVGTLRMVEAALNYNIDRFVFVSTDKAVNPKNVMGASKRVSEKLLTCHAANRSSDTKFMIVRFGNVVGSVGSVVPVFKKQIAAGGPVTVTHPDATRYFMTIPEACQLILQAGAMGEGGEIFILDMGSAVKIDDMARDLINLSGFEPEADIAIEYIGLRAGEKLHEELHAPDENVISTTHPKIMMIRNSACDLVNLEKAIEELVAVCDHKNSASIRRKLQAIIETYEPAASIPASGHGGP